MLFIILIIILEFNYPQSDKNPEILLVAFTLLLGFFNFLQWTATREMIDATREASETSLKIALMLANRDKEKEEEICEGRFFPDKKTN